MDSRPERNTSPFYHCLLPKVFTNDLNTQGMILFPHLHGGLQFTSCGIPWNLSRLFPLVCQEKSSARSSSGRNFLHLARSSLNNLVRTVKVVQEHTREDDPITSANDYYFYCCCERERVTTPFWTGSCTKLRYSAAYEYFHGSARKATAH